MTTLRALIVDDSRTAQFRLKKLLDRYELEVDLATSAEEALGYLSYKMPTVIFLDHHMEGMDGFDALKIIKANPTTATIPVIMYTSKSDELYAGQAHALGALDTLSKSLMKPERVEEVLAKLRIYPRGEQAAESGETGENTPPIPNYGKQPPYTPNNGEQQDLAISAAEIKAQIARLFELHIADVRTQIAENTKFVVRRLAGEIKTSARKSEETKEPTELAANDFEHDETPKATANSGWLFAIVFVALGVISFQVFQSNKHTRQLEENIAQLVEINMQNTLLLEDAVTMATIDDIGLPNRINYIKLLETLSWALSVDMHFPFGEVPLNDGQILNLQTLAFRLQEAGFRGFVELDVQLGDYCVKQSQGGQWEIPPPGTLLSECEFLSNQGLDLSPENYTSLAYVQFEQSAAPVRSGEIEFMINVSGFDSPRYEYPNRVATTSAGEWNAIAAKNQQVVMSVEAEDYAISAN